MQTDHTGVDEVAGAIKLSKKTKFRITKAGIQKNSFPVYESTDSTTNEKAVLRFLEWAEITDNCIPYNLELFSNKEEDEAAGLEYDKKLGNRRLTFKLNKEEKYSSHNQHQNNHPQYDKAAIIENALLKQKAFYENNELMKRLEAMDQKLNEYMEEEEDDDRSELNGLNNPNIVNLLGLLTKALNTSKPAVVNGVTLQTDQITNINKAVKILSRYDDQIDTDLLKLANLAETNTATFEMLLRTLRSM